MKRLYLLRHCSTRENESGINGSRTDSPLSERGTTEAKRLVVKLSKHEYDLIIVSPLQRTIQTLEPYIQTLKHKPIVLTEQLTNERDLGKFTNSTIGNQIPKDIAIQGVGEVLWQPQGGESTIQVAARARRFLEKLKQRPEESILICGHQNFLRCLELMVRGEPIDDKHFLNGSVPRLKNGEVREIILK